MKRIFSILLITALLVGLLPMMGTVALAEEYATVTSENGYGVRLREGPSKAYGVIGKYDVGTTVVVLQSGTEWSQLQIGETVGWMQNKYLIFGATGSIPGSTGSAVTGVANATVTSGNGLRVWLRATAGGKRLDLYSPGTPVTVLERGNTWCRVSIGGSIGYMMTQFLAFEQPPAPASLKVTGVSINYPYPVVGDTLEAIVTPEDATVKYSWKVDGVELGTEPTFSVLTRYANQKITLTVTGIGAYYGSATATAQAKVQISTGLKSVQLSTTAPVVGDVISAIIQPSSAVVEYSWRVAGVEVSTDATYTVTSADVGKLIQLKVKGLDGYEGSVACTAKQNVVSDKEIQSVELSKKYPVVGEVITAAVLPEGADVKYTWTVDGEVVSTSSSYQTSKLQLGKQVKVTVEGVDPYTGTATDISTRVSAAELTSVRINQMSPVTGDRLIAQAMPLNATADYFWYADNVLVGVGSYLNITEAMANKKIFVTAIGTGVYSGEVDSDETAAVISRKVITGVALNNTSPVVGDVIEAIAYPRNVEEHYQTYVWTIDTETAPNHDQYYTVKESDVGKVIRVKLTGTNGYVGEVYSNYTNPVLASMDIVGVSIYNSTKDNNSSQNRPEVGDALTAQINPGQATATYDWTIDGVSVGTGASYTVKAADADKQIVVTATGTGNYKGEKAAITAPVLQLKPLVAQLKFAAPKEGMPPVYSTSYKDADENVICTGSIEWLTSTFARAVLDRYGHFEPNTDYIAAITLKLANGYTMNGAAIDVDGATVIGRNGNTVYAQFPTTGGQQITDYYISEIARPHVGAKPTSSFAAEQYKADITWDHVGSDGMFENAEVYTATFKIVAINDYTTTGLEKDIFHVGTADATYYDPATETVTAVFKIGRTLTVKADKSEVYLDGYNSRIVQCSAELSDYVGEVKTVEWDIVEATVDATSIDKNGQLVIGMYEAADRSLTIRATVTLTTGEVYVGTTSVALISGSDTDTSIKVEFKQAANQIIRGGKGYFEAVVSNSTAGSTIFAIWNDSTSVALTDGWLSIAPTETAKKIIVKAISNEDHAVTASVIVEIVDSLGSLGIEGVEDEMIIVEGELAEDEIVIETIDPAVEGEAAAEGEAAVEEVPAEPEVEITEPTEEVPAVEEEVTEEVPAEPEIEITEPTEEVPAVEEEVTEEVPAEPEIEITEPTEEVPAVEEEVTEEVPAEPEIEITEPAEEVPAVEEEVTEEVPAEPVIEIIDTTEEIPAVEEVTEEEPAEPTIEITITTEETPVVEDEPLTDVVIEIKDTVTGEVVVPEEVPAVEETEEEEIPEGVVIAITDTVTGEVIVEEQPADQEIVIEEKAEEKKPAKKDSEETADVETEEEELDPELDDLEGDKDVGESNAESAIKIRFVEMVSEISRGKTALFSVMTEGTEQGVRWSVRRSMDADGNKVSSISEEGVLSVSKDETAEKLIVVATSLEDNTVRARWIVTVKNAVKSSSKSAATETVEDEEIVVEETIEEPVVEETEEEYVETEAEDEGLTEEQLRQIQEELEALEAENGVLDLF